MLAVSPLLLVMMVSLATAEDGYCALSPRHTLCRYTGLGRACGGRALGRGVTRAEVGGAAGDNGGGDDGVAGGDHPRHPQPAAGEAGPGGGGQGQPRASASRRGHAEDGKLRI